MATSLTPYTTSAAINESASDCPSNSGTARLAIKINNRLLRAVAAILISVLVSLVLFIVVGLLVPVLLMNLSFGRQSVLGAPGNGGAILLVIAPIAAIVCFIFMFGFIVYFYEKLTE
jgi:hypothetical protein